MDPGGWSDTTLRRVALAGFGFVAAIAVLNPAMGRGVGGRPLSNDATVIDYGDSVFCLLLATSALLILWFRPRHSVGWLLLLVAMIEDLAVLGQTYGERAVVIPEEHLPLGTLALELSAPLWLLTAFIPMTCVLLRYPTGRIEGRWARRVDRSVVIGLGILWFGYATSSNSVTDAVKGHLPPVRLTDAISGGIMAVGALVVLPSAVFTLVHTALRTWRASYPERQQLAWLLTVTTVAVTALFLPYEGLQRLFYGVPLAIVVGVLRYRLVGIEVVVRRTLLYGTLTGLVLLVFVAVTALLQSVLPDGGAPTILAAGIVAVGVVPLRDRLQRGVDRFVYGDRGDPLSALKKLGAPVGLTADATLLPEVLSAIAAAVRVPGAEIVGQLGSRAQVGAPSVDTTDIPLVMGGEGVGVLRLARRPGESHLPAADRGLVEGLAPLVAVVLRSVELAEQLRVERERVVAATEAERSRLRRDLHDGLGPSLTGIGLGLEAAQSAAPDRASAILTRLRQEAAASLDEVRRIIDDLRPGALETADLLTLLGNRAEHLSATAGVRVRLQAPASLPDLPTDVADAALRIVEEALNNVVKHAGARSCTIAVHEDDGLALEVRDDGVGYGGPRPGGVGVASMQARAEQLGGSCVVASNGSGTVVTVHLPLTLRV